MTLIVYQVLVASEITGLLMLGHLARDSIVVCIAFPPLQSRMNEPSIV